MDGATVPSNYELHSVSEVDHSTIATRHGEIDDLIGTPPGRLLRSGITMLFLAFSLLVSMAFVLRYPDKIYAPAVITSEEPPIDVLIPLSARLDTLLTVNGALVDEDQILAYMESTAKRWDLRELEEFSTRLLQADDQSCLSMFTLPERRWNLGDLQPAGEQLLQLVREHCLITSKINPSIQIASIDHELDNLEALARHMRSEQRLLNAELLLITRDVKRYGTLLQAGVISEREYELKLSDSLSLAKQYHTVAGSQIRNDIRISQLRALRVEKSEQYQDILITKWLEILDQASEIRALITSWDFGHAIRASVAGKVILPLGTEERQLRSEGDYFCSIVPVRKSNLIARARLPSYNRGKLIRGNKVLLRLDAYPYKEYGSVTTALSYLSPLPRRDEQLGTTYEARIDLPGELVTDNGFEVPYHPNMVAELVCITEDRSLAKRVLAQFVTLVK